MDGRTALYRIWGDGDLLLYIGISNDFGTRWKRHAQKQPWWDEMRRLTADRWFDSREDAKTAERATIKAENPKYNIVRPENAYRAPMESDSGDDLLSRYEAGEWVEIMPGHRRRLKTGANVGDWFPLGSS